MTLKCAVELCKGSGLTGWDLVGYAQQLVNRTMTYSLENSFDLPPLAFEKGMGYCWHQASALNEILLELGFDSRRVHAFRNLFPLAELAGVVVHDFVTGHVWCRVILDGLEKDVCPGNKNNKPGVIDFKPLGKVREWNKWINGLTYYGAALFNDHRRRKYGHHKMEE